MPGSTRVLVRFGGWTAEDAVFPVVWAHLAPVSPPSGEYTDFPPWGAPFHQLSWPQPQR